MKTWWCRFNTYLAVSLALTFICGCDTEKSKQKKIVATLRLHQELRPDPMGKTEEATIFREHPIKMTIAREPFLTEAHVKEAKVIDSLGGFAVSIQFDRQGTWLLEQFTAATRGKHVLIFSQFIGPKEEKLNKGRWLAAPKIQNHIADGLIIFTPDATREEAERIALGLSNVAKKLGNNEESAF